MRWFLSRLDTNTERCEVSYRNLRCEPRCGTRTPTRNFGDQRIREKAIVIDADAVGVRMPVLQKFPVLVRGDAEDRGLETEGRW